MKTLNFSDLRTANVARCEDAFNAICDWSPTDWACAMAGECGEACNEIKKLRRLDGADSDSDTPQKREEIRVKVGAELADIIIYADLLAKRLDLDLGQCVVDKFNEVSERRGSSVRL